MISMENLLSEVSADSWSPLFLGFLSLEQTVWFLDVRGEFKNHGQK